LILSDIEKADLLKTIKEVDLTVKQPLPKIEKNSLNDMSYWKKTVGKNYQSIDKFDQINQVQTNSNEFYEFEPAIVLDVVLDEKT